VKLLLDEQYSPEIAAQLRSAGHDVVSVQDLGLTGLADERLLETALEQERVLVTNDVRDFASLAAEWAAQGREHHGLLFTSDESLPRGKNTIGVFVNVLRRLLDERLERGALRGQVAWLSDR